VYYAFFAFLARRFSFRVLPAGFFELLPPLSLFAIGVLQTGDRSGNRDTSVSHHGKLPENQRARNFYESGGWQTDNLERAATFLA
jgi:hypothetical protein